MWGILLESLPDTTAAEVVMKKIPEFFESAITEYLTKAEPAVLTEPPSDEDANTFALSDQWRSTKAFIPCGSLYPDGNKIINHSAKARKNFRKSPVQSVAVADQQTITPAALAGYPNCMNGGADSWLMDLPGLLDETNASKGIVQFLVDRSKEPGDPDAIMGFIVSGSVFACAVGGRDLEVIVPLSAVYIAPQYRGYGFGPLLCGAFGYQLGQSLTAVCPPLSA
jgi:hypothetical protein